MSDTTYEQLSPNRLAWLCVVECFGSLVHVDSTQYTPLSMYAQVDKYIRKLDTDAKRLEIELIRPDAQPSEHLSTIKKSV